MNTASRSEAPSVMFLVSHSSAGGAQEIWANLAEGFYERGYRVTLAALYPLRETVRETADHLQWSYVVEQRPRNPWAVARLAWALVRRLRREAPQIVFTAMPAANVLAAACAWLAGGRSRVVISHHSPVQTHNPALNVLDSIAGSLSSVQAVVSVSDTVASSLNAKGNAYRAKRVTIHNALPPRIEALLGDLAAQAVSGRARSRTVVATGRLAEQKNYPLLIRAAGLLKDVTFKIVGEGPDRDMLTALRREVGAEDNVQFLGHRPREEALKELAEADLFVQVSLFEGHSLALVEAAKLGLPLVVSNVPVQVEAVTSSDRTLSARLVGIDDPEELAQAIRHLLDDEGEYALLSALSWQLGVEASYPAMLAAYEKFVK